MATLWTCPANAEQFDQQKEALARAIETFAPTNQSMAITVIVSTHGDNTKEDATHETFAGPVIAVPRTVVSSSSRSGIASMIRGIEQPRAFNHDFGPGDPLTISNCFHNEAEGCPTGSNNGWSLLMAAQHLNEMGDARATREVCLGGDFSFAFGLTPRSFNELSESLPPEALSISRAVATIQTSEFEIDTLSMLHLQRPSIPILLNPLRTATIEGSAADDGDLVVSVHVETTTNSPGTLVGFVNVPLTAGDDAETIATKIAFELQVAPWASGSAMSIEAIRQHLVMRESFLSVPFDGEERAARIEISGIDGVRVTHDEMGSFQLTNTAIARALALRTYGPLSYGEGSFFEHFTNDADYGRAFTRCLQPSLRVTAIEANQVIQDGHNSVTLVHGKDTMVRAHVEQSSERGVGLALGGQPAELTLSVSRCMDEACTSPVPLADLDGENEGYLVPLALGVPLFDDIASPADEVQPTQRYTLAPTWLHGRLRLELRWADGELLCAPGLESVDDHTCATEIEFQPHPTGNTFTISPFEVTWPFHSPPLGAWTRTYRTSARWLPVNFLNEEGDVRVTAEVRARRRLSMIRRIHRWSSQERTAPISSPSSWAISTAYGVANAPPAVATLEWCTASIKTVRSMMAFFRKPPLAAAR